MVPRSNPMRSRSLAAALFVAAIAPSARAQPAWNFDPQEATLGAAAWSRADNFDNGSGVIIEYNRSDIYRLEPGFVYDGQARNFGAAAGPAAAEFGSAATSLTVATAAAVLTVDGVQTGTLAVLISMITAEHTLGAQGWDASAGTVVQGDLIFRVTGLTPGVPCTISYSWDYAARADAPSEATNVHDDRAQAFGLISLNIDAGAYVPLLGAQANSQAPYSPALSDLGAGSLAFTPSSSTAIVRLNANVRSESSATSPGADAAGDDGSGSEFTARLRLTVAHGSVGACCLGATCSVTTQQSCLGRYAGDATTCAAPAAGEPASCCPSDFDHDGQIVIADLFSFLRAWFAARPITDMDGNGVDVGDIFAYLRRWFAGC